MSDLKVSELLAQRAKLIDDVRHYSGNEASGYAEIARLNEKIIDASAREHASLTLEVAQLKQALSSAWSAACWTDETGPAERRLEGYADALNSVEAICNEALNSEADRAALKESPHVR